MAQTESACYHRTPKESEKQRTETNGTIKEKEKEPVVGKTPTHGGLIVRTPNNVQNIAKKKSAPSSHGEQKPETKALLKDESRKALEEPDGKQKEMVKEKEWEKTDAQKSQMTQAFIESKDKTKDNQKDVVRCVGSKSSKTTGTSKERDKDTVVTKTPSSIPNTPFKDISQMVKKKRMRGEKDDRAKVMISMKELASVRKTIVEDTVTQHDTQISRKTTKKNSVTQMHTGICLHKNDKEVVKKYDRKSDKFNYQEFLDRHYSKIEPGVHEIVYTDYEYEHITTIAAKVLYEEETLLSLAPPITIVGDIHGQFNDLQNIFLLIGRPPERRYLFLGDYVDRGGMSLECIMMLLAYKIYYPDYVYLLRGNHECPRVNKRYGFYDDCKRLRNGEVIWALFQRAFNNMPIAALISKKIFCMHGGLSPELDSFDMLKNVHKPIRNPFRGLVNDMLWADPDVQYPEWRNSSRGSGFAFGERVIEDVCSRLDIELIVRAHQVCLDGFWSFSNRRLITIFSAPSYCNQFHNASAVLAVSEKLECQLISFVPDVKSPRNRVRKNQLWNDSCDVIAEIVANPSPPVR